MVPICFGSFALITVSDNASTGIQYIGLHWRWNKKCVFCDDIAYGLFEKEYQCVSAVEKLDGRNAPVVVDLGTILM